MADLKISQLTAISVLTPATDVLPVVDVGGVTKKITTNQILGSGGTATLASATITGDLTVDTSTLKVDSTNNRVGIGTATPGRPLEVYNTTESTVWAQTTTGISLFRSGGTSGDFYFGIDNSTGAGFGQGNYSRLIYSTGAYPIVFSTNATERARFNSTGNLAFANGLGIDFSAVTGGTGTATANVLNDYEEGTWTPTIAAETGTIGATVVNSANYTKIGRLVSVTFDITITSTGTGTAGLKLSLPFSCVAGNTAGALREYQVTGNMGQVYRFDATNLLCNSYNNSTLIVSNYKVMGGYTYFAS